MQSSNRGSALKQFTLWARKNPLSEDFNTRKIRIGEMRDQTGDKTQVASATVAGTSSQECH
jgi:hypothetical protein